MKVLALLALLALTMPGWARAAPTTDNETTRTEASERAPAKNEHFIVKQVLTDFAIDNLARRYFRDDPRFLGRLVTIAPATVEIDDGTGACTEVRRKVSRQTPTAAIAAELSRRSINHPKHPTPADLKLAAGKAPVEVTRYTCIGPGEMPPGQIWNGATSFPVPHGRVAVIWESEIVLVLAAAPESIAPTFDCARAASQSEKAICADPGLSSWDRSIAKALTVARKGNFELPPVEDMALVAEAQREWLTQRDACGADRDCLLDRMSERVTALLDR